jgi:hypothetical protein
VFALLLLGHLVFYGIMGEVPDRPTGALVGTLFGVWAAAMFGVAYVTVWRRTAR